MQTQQSTPLAPYGSMNHLALVAKVGEQGKGTTPAISSRTVVRRTAAQ
jgi:hypothetical protein